MKTRKPRQSKRALYELTAARAVKTVLPRVDQETLNRAWNDVLNGIEAGKQTRTAPLPDVTLDFSQTAFEVFPSNETAATYLHTLMQYEADDMIGDDTWLDGLVSIRDYLWQSRKVAR